MCGEGSFCLADLHRQLASHVSPQLISNQHRPAHAQRHAHTHPLSITQEALFIDASPSLPFSLLFRPHLPSLFISLGICVWLGTSNISKRKRKKTAVLTEKSKTKQKQISFFIPITVFGFFSFLHFTYLKRVLER